MAFKFRRNINIGSLEAESDRFLLSAFVEKSDLAILKNTSNPKCVVAGRTGVGKSALILYLEQHEEHIVRIRPESISLRHLSNSDIINYFKRLDVKLDLFYKVLWKHVFIVELIKLYFNNNTTISENFRQWLRERLPDKKRKQAIEYLQKWEDKFWEHTEYRVKELENSLEKRFKEAIGAHINLSELFSAESNTEKERSEAKKVTFEVLNKAQRVVNESQIEEIEGIFELMKSELFKSKTQRRYYIVIDDLDKEWVSNAIVYDLIKALIEVLKEIGRLSSVKVIVALRSNILKKTFRYNTNRGFQREKYDDLFVRIEWSKSELIDLINRRLAELMKGEYTKDTPRVEDILPAPHKKHGDAFEYMLARTFMRPRDLIDYFNKCIKNADDKAKFTWEIIRLAEDEYSQERLRALNDEWLENYGNLHVLYRFFRGYAVQFTRKDAEKALGDHFIEIISDESVKQLSAGLQADFAIYGDNYVVQPIMNKVLILLYEVGLLGIKISPESKLDYSFNSYTLHEESDLTDDTKFVVHPMFRRGLRSKHEDI
jgi:hypothetical protein